MKLLLGVLTIAFSSLAFAAYSEDEATCFRADHPESIEGSILNPDGDVVAQERAKEAHLKIYIAKYDEYPAMNRSRLTVTTVSNKKIVVSALKDETREGRYYVECDGGSMNIDLFPSKAVVTSERIRGDLEGCDGSASISTPGTNFSQVACE